MILVLIIVIVVITKQGKEIKMSDSIVRTAVDGFVQKGFMFTAYDVTKFLRKAGERVRHNEVNDIVKAMYSNSEMGQYKREIKDVGAPVSPFVYAHTYSDVNDYDVTWVDTNPNQDGMKYDTANVCSAYVPLTTTPTPVPANIPVVPKAPKVSLPDGVHKVTSEGRLNIPIDAVKKVAGSYSDFDVFVSLSKVILCPSAKTPSTVKINSDGRIRLGRNTLKQISSGDLFRVLSCSGLIEVTPA